MTLWRIVGLYFLPFMLTGCVLIQPLPPAGDDFTRALAFPKVELPVSEPVTVYWNRYNVPYIHARNNSDLAFTLGLVHAHLRLGQMEMLKRIAYGRISEMAGPFTIDLDRAIRTLNPGKAVPDQLRTMPVATRNWLESYTRGINYYVDHTAQLPPEFDLLDLEREPWTPRDVLTIGRLAASDVNWITYFYFAGKLDDSRYRAVYERLQAFGSESQPSFQAGAASTLAYITAGLSRSGSNSIAIGSGRSRDAVALLANDPHLGVMLPNFWVLVGLQSPDLHAVGMSIPGIPVIALGRNDQIAWGGTNMRSHSSDLYDVSHLPENRLHSRTEPIQVRWWPDTDVTIRSTEFGPIVSDIELLEIEERRLALRWTGHEITDELTAFLDVMRAQNFEQFRHAFRLYGASGQNYLYADDAGNIGQVLAAYIPQRNDDSDLILDARDEQTHWRGFYDATRLPYAYNPADGYLASANNRPVISEPSIGRVFSANDRIHRLQSFMRTNRRVSISDLKSLQQDVYSAAAFQLRDLLLEQLQNTGLVVEIERQFPEFTREFTYWDGRFDARSRGALAFSLTAATLGRRIYEPRYGEQLTDFILGGELALFFLMEDTRSGVPSNVLRVAFLEAGETFGEFDDWGHMHRLRLSHPLANIPGSGERYVFFEGPVDGSSSTLMKSAHRLSLEKHNVSYGAQARHISVMGRPDENYFVLLGGQDGFLNNAGMVDQVPLWLRGKYIRFPLRLKSIQKEFTTVWELLPGIGD